MSVCTRTWFSGRRAVFVALLAATAGVAGAEPRQPTFERDVRPILKRHCFHCHGEGEKLKAGLDVRLRRFLVEPHGSDGAFAIIPGKPDESELIILVREGEMPKEGKELSAAEIAVLEKWIAQGAQTARPEPDEVPSVWVSEEDREFWAFQPINRPAIPRCDGGAVSNPIDAFLLAKLEAAGIIFNPEADKATLLRRVLLDLTGLPPTPEETAAFLADQAPDAYARMVERALASPHYGERWGRHWMDVAGYSDSDGYTDADTVRPWSFKYRDYVIRSFNADKPFDQFIREQLAGDEMVKQPYKNLSSDDIEKLAATGFLRMVPDGTETAEEVDQPTARHAVIAETIKVVSSSLLGITVGCAQCHEHKHDPVPQADYYRMRAIFEPALDTVRWRKPTERLVSMLADEERAKAGEIESEAKLIDEQRQAKEAEFIEKVLTWELDKRPEELREPLRIAYRMRVDKRTPEQIELLKEHPTIGQLTSRSLYLYDPVYKTRHREELTKIADQAAEVRKRKPAENFLPVLNEVPGAPIPATHLFLRGDFGQPREKVGPGELTVLGSTRAGSIPDKSPDLATTGRRLAFAQSLTDGSHPLTARVLVNRIWYHHFGRGIVGSLGDFGQLGDRPSHPELLDWLASEFVAKGWSLKALHRLILESITYRQSSARNTRKDQIDPDNRLHGRASVRRLEAETIRDAVLHVSGKLNPKMFGAPVPVTLDKSGRVIIGSNTDDRTKRIEDRIVPLASDEKFRRSIYIQMRRSQPLGIFDSFDFPVMEPNCEARNSSTVATQSLVMMNSDFILEQSEYFAERVARETGAEIEIRVKRAWQLAFGVSPGAGELEAAVGFITTQIATFKANPLRPAKPPKGEQPPPANPAMQALATFCQALLTSNQFLYID